MRNLSSVDLMMISFNELVSYGVHQSSSLGLFDCGEIGGQKR